MKGHLGTEITTECTYSSMGHGDPGLYTLQTNNNHLRCSHNSNAFKADFTKRNCENLLCFKRVQVMKFRTINTT